MNNWMKPDQAKAAETLNQLTETIRQAVVAYVQLEAKRIEHMVKATAAMIEGNSVKPNDK